MIRRTDAVLIYAQYTNMIKWVLRGREVGGEIDTYGGEGKEM